MYIISKIESIIKYYSEDEYYITIKNSNGEEISLDDLVDQYYGNPDKYFGMKQDKNKETELKEDEEPNKNEQVEKEIETPEEKRKREEVERNKWV